MRTGLLARLDALLAAGGEADDLLRATAALLVDEPGISFAEIRFLEGAELVPGPATGAPDEERRTRVPIAFHGERVGELHVDGEADDTLLEAVAARIAELVLVGWDTGGEPWEP